MSNRLISVVIPAYNAEPHVGAAIDSILAQTFTDFELLLIDDGSTDGTLAAMQQRAARDARIRIISRPNRGFIHSLNEGVAESRGEWIGRMDADDLSESGRLAQQLAWVREQRADVCGSWIRTFGNWLPQTRRFHADDARLRFQLVFNSCFAHPTVFARREVLAAHPYSRTALHVEDYELWCRLAAAGHRLANTPAVLLRYRVHAGQVSQRKRHEQAAARRLIAEGYRASCFPEIPARIHARILSREELLAPEDIAEVADWFAAEIARGVWPSDVLRENAFIFLTRHAEAGTGAMRRYAAACRLAGLRGALPVLLARAGATQESRLFQFIYAMR